MTFRTESLRTTLWMELTKRKRPPSFLRMLTEYPGQICSLYPEEKVPSGAGVGTGAARGAGQPSLPPRSAQNPRGFTSQLAARFQLITPESRHRKQAP